jgi:RNA polymerase sigma factor (sigma-70 family)
LARVLADLGTDQRTVIVLHYFAGLTLEAVAEQTGERLGTVKSRLHAALGALHAGYDAADRDGEGNLR